MKLRNSEKYISLLHTSLSCLQPLLSTCSFESWNNDLKESEALKLQQAWHITFSPTNHNANWAVSWEDRLEQNFAREIWLDWKVKHLVMGKEITFTKLDQGLGAGKSLSARKGVGVVFEIREWMEVSCVTVVGDGIFFYKMLWEVLGCFFPPAFPIPGVFVSKWSSLKK